MMRSQAATLRLAALPDTGAFTDVVLICLGAGLLAGSAQVAIRQPVIADAVGAGETA